MIRSKIITRQFTLKSPKQKKGESDIVIAEIITWINENIKMGYMIGAAANHKESFFRGGFRRKKYLTIQLELIPDLTLNKARELDGIIPLPEQEIIDKWSRKTD